jgi:hypothetical protein
MVRTWTLTFAIVAAFGSTAIGQSSPPAADSTARAVHPLYVPKPDSCALIVEPSATPSLALVTYRPQQYWFWAQVDYLGWFLNGSQLPPLVTASPPGMARAQAGVLGAPGTQVLFGNETINDDYRSGVRLRLGGWLDDCRTTGFEVSALVLDRQSSSFIAGSADGSQIISRPFFDVTTGQQNAELVSFPGVLGGTVTVGDAESSKFWAVDAVCRKSVCRDCNSYLDVLAGYRYLQFGDGVRIVERLRPLPPASPPGSLILLTDEFRASNRFHGGVVGLAAGYSTGMFTVDLRANVAVGETSRTVSINGATQITTSVSGTTTATGGLLALPSNIGVYRSSDWTVVPDFEVTIGCWLKSYCRLVVGYSCQYWPGVARAGEQIDLAVNSTQLPPGTLVGPARPAFNLQRSDLWAHGFSIGLEFRY